MALILSIDTSIDTADVSLARNGVLLASETNTEPKNHGSFLQLAIKRILSSTNTNINTLDAIAVANGPGSYTGLRVGLSSAKGLCFTLNRPLITISTLEILARTTRQQFMLNNNYLFCPMIDARRMEVFTAMYNYNMDQVLPTQAMILDENSFAQQLDEKVIVFSGNGSHKLKNIINHPNALFANLETPNKIAATIAISEAKYLIKNFDNLAYSEPYYVKDVFFAEKSK
jgi:tRNA threonylcarbamoyladenosine biosynthesis protein TsaB